MGMDLKLLVVCLGAVLAVNTVTANNNKDEMYIMIEGANLFTCRNVQNRLHIRREDISIRDENGREVHYIHAPGEYAIHFHHITVKEPIPNLSGEISATLQVPLFESSGGLRFDVPYQAIPETGLLRQRCDKQSGIVKRGKKTYCRYCDLCETTEDIEKELNTQGHKYLPEIRGGREEAFAPACVQISENSYELIRTVRLPGRDQLEQHANKNFKGLEGELKKRLDRGEGKLQVSLNLLSSNRPPMTKDQFYRSSNKCVCCSQQGVRNDFRCKVLGFLYCDEQECNAEYAEQCLQGSSEIVACYTVEFNYKVTTDYNEVRSFLYQRGLPERERGQIVPSRNVRPNRRQGPIVAPRPHPRIEPNVRGNKKPDNRRGGGPSSSRETAKGGGDSERCLAAISPELKDLKQYCTIFWRPSFCCPHCEGHCGDN